jgi:hypothetical protein
MLFPAAAAALMGSTRCLVLVFPPLSFVAVAATRSIVPRGPATLFHLCVRPRPFLIFLATFTHSSLS